MKHTKPLAKSATGWAWRFTWDNGVQSLGYWAQPTRKMLLSEGKPSPEAVATKVRIMENSEYLALVKASKGTK